jgi:hypothetical protein
MAVRLAHGLLAMAAGLAAMPVDAEKPAFRSGIYSSFFVHPETGDELGQELELHLGAAPYAFFTACEGACSPVRRVAVEIVGGRLHFTYPQPLVDEHGKALPPQWLRFTASPRGTGLILRQEGTDGTPERLRRIVARRALALSDLRPAVSMEPPPR